MTESRIAELAKTEIKRLDTPSPVSAECVLSVGIVGAGEIVSRVHLPVLTACEGIRIIYVADKRAQAAQCVAQNYKVASFGVDDNLEKLPQTDVVLLAVPVTARGPYYDLFAKRGTCVLAEKPLSTCDTDAVRVCELYPDHALACGFQRRSYGSVILTKLLVAENWFGPLRSISISEGALTTKTGANSRFYDDAASGGGGVLMDLGCHSLDTAIYVSDAREAIPVRQHFVFDGGVDREVNAHLNLRTPGGACELDYFVTWLRRAKNTIELCFDNCTVELSCRPAQEITIRGAQNHRPVASMRMKHAGAATVYQAFYLEWTAFLEGVRRNQASKFSASSCLPTIRAVEALYSAGKRKP